MDYPWQECVYALLKTATSLSYAMPATACGGCREATGEQSVLLQIHDRAIRGTIAVRLAPCVAGLHRVDRITRQDHVIRGRSVGLRVRRVIAGPDQDRVLVLDALLQELLVDVHVMPGLAVGLHVVFLAGQLRGVGGVEAGCGGFVMLELPAQRKLRVPLGVLAVDVGARQRVAVRTARLAGAALTGLQDDLGAAGLAIELDRLLGEVEDGRGDDIAIIVLDADLDVGFLELRRVAVLRRRAVGGELQLRDEIGVTVVDGTQLGIGRSGAGLVVFRGLAVAGLGLATLLGCRLRLSRLGVGITQHEPPDAESGDKRHDEYGDDDADDQRGLLLALAGGLSRP